MVDGRLTDTEIRLALETVRASGLVADPVVGVHPSRVEEARALAGLTLFSGGLHRGVGYLGQYDGAAVWALPGVDAAALYVLPAGHVLLIIGAWLSGGGAGELGPASQ